MEATIQPRRYKKPLSCFFYVLVFRQPFVLLQQSCRRSAGLKYYRVKKEREGGTNVKCGTIHTAHFSMWVIEALSLYLGDRESAGHEMGWHFGASVPPVSPCASEEQSAMESRGGGEPWRHKAPLWSQRSWARPCCVEPQSPDGNKDPPMRQHGKESDVSAATSATGLTAPGKVV